MKEITTEAIKSFTQEQGADCVGVVSAEGFPASVPPRAPESVLSGAKSVVVFGIAMLSGSIGSPSSNVGTTHSNEMYAELSRLSYQVGRLLERGGYRAATIPPHLPLEMSKETKGMVADLSLKHAAVGAGLGVWGRSHLVITPQWGPRVRLAAVVTDAPLTPDSPMEEQVCDNCDLCLQACPVQALQPGEVVKTTKCLVNLQKYGLTSYIKYFSDLLSKPLEEQQQALRDTHFWNLYQTASITMSYHCFECLKACPVGN